MNIRSAIALNEYLNSELGWRKRDLTNAKFAIAGSKEHARETMIRGAICLLYAHWEGFIKHACMAYLNYLAKQGLTQREAAPSIIAYCMAGRFRALADTKKYSLVSDIVSTMIGPGSEPLSIPWDKVMDDTANLNSVVLREIAHIVCIDYSHYETKEKLIDEKLLRARHAIAHGDRQTVILADYEELHGQVLSLIELFRNQVENSAILGSYRRPQS